MAAVSIPQFYHEGVLAPFAGPYGSASFQDTNEVAGGIWERQPAEVQMR